MSTTEFKKSAGWRALNPDHAIEKMRDKINDMAHEQYDGEFQEVLFQIIERNLPWSSFAFSVREMAGTIQDGAEIMQQIQEVSAGLASRLTGNPDLGKFKTDMKDADAKYNHEMDEADRAFCNGLHTCCRCGKPKPVGGGWLPRGIPVVLFQVFGLSDGWNRTDGQTEGGIVPKTLKSIK